MQRVAVAGSETRRQALQYGYMYIYTTASGRAPRHDSRAISKSIRVPRATSTSFDQRQWPRHRRGPGARERPLNAPTQHATAQCSPAAVQCSSATRRHTQTRSGSAHVHSFGDDCVMTRMSRTHRRYCACVVAVWGSRNGPPEERQRGRVNATIEQITDSAASVHKRLQCRTRALLVQQLPACQQLAAIPRGSNRVTSTSTSKKRNETKAEQMIEAQAHDETSIRMTHRSILLLSTPLHSTPLTSTANVNQTWISRECSAAYRCSPRPTPHLSGELNSPPIWLANGR